MERLKRGWVFWLLLLATAVLPASAQTVKKQLYLAAVVDQLQGVGDVQVGQAMLIVSQSGYQYMVRTSYYQFLLSKLSLAIDGDVYGRQVVLCDNAGSTPCVLSGWDLEGAIVPLMLQYAENGPITAHEFSDALTSGHLIVKFNDGDLGSGALVRIF